jgi:acyl carrier protein
MTPDQAHEAIAAALSSIAPEVDLTQADPEALMGEELDLDSMDLLELSAALQDRTGVEIAADDPSGATLAGLVALLVEGAGSSG